MTNQLFLTQKIIRKFKIATSLLSRRGDYSFNKLMRKIIYSYILKKIINE